MAARRLRGKDAHGGRGEVKTAPWWRLNFPTKGEVKRAKERGALLTKESKVAASKRQRKSKFVGVNWDKTSRKWKAVIWNDGKREYLGNFDDERKAARAIDKRRLQLRAVPRENT